MLAAELISEDVTEREHPFDAETIARLRAHPDFPRLARLIARSFIDQYAGNRFLNLISNDRGRLQVAFAVLYLHYNRDPSDPSSGLSSSRLKAFCAQHRICSPGRAAAMLAVMQMAGHVVAAPPTGDKRLRLLMPTAKLLNSFRDRWVIAFDALAQIKPQAADIARALRARDAFAHIYLCIVFGHHIAGHRVIEQIPDLGAFVDANAGLLIFLSLFAATEAGGTGATAVRMPVAVLARRFGVSRPHVKQVLRAMQEDGLVTVQSDRILLSPRLIEAAHRFFAVMLAFEWYCGRRALKAADKLTP